MNINGFFSFCYQRYYEKIPKIKTTSAIPDRLNENPDKIALQSIFDRSEIADGYSVRTDTHKTTIHIKTNMLSFRLQNTFVNKFIFAQLPSGSRSRDVKILLALIRYEPPRRLCVGERSTVQGVPVRECVCSRAYTGCGATACASGSPIY